MSPDDPTTTRRKVIDEVYRLALDLCTCEHWEQGRPHGYMCPTRRLRKRLRRLDHADTEES